MPNQTPHPKSTVIRDWLRSDPIIRALPEAPSFEAHAEGMDAAWASAEAASKTGGKFMVLRHRHNRGKFVQIAATGGEFSVTPFDRFGFEAVHCTYPSYSVAIKAAIELGYWHLSNSSLARLQSQPDWTLGTEQKRVFQQYRAKKMSLIELVQKMPVEPPQSESTGAGDASCMLNSIH